MAVLRQSFLTVAVVFPALTWVLAPAAAADNCTLKIAASIATERGPSGVMLVPVMLTGKKKLLLLDTGGGFSELVPQAVAELGLNTRLGGLLQYDVRGKAVDQVADVDEVELGPFKIRSMQFMISSSDFGENSNIYGILAPNIFSAYDLDLDFPNQKLQLISQDHCPGQVVYWPNDALAVIPMQVTEENHIVFPMQLDGHTVQTMLDTGASQTTLSLRIAEGTFGIDTKSPDVEKIGQLTDSAGSATYHHRFHTLSVEGITVNNPMIDLIPDLMRNYLTKPPPIGTRLSSSHETQGLPELMLGVSVLQHLHVYIAYKEKMIYVTAGRGAPPAAAR